MKKLINAIVEKAQDVYFDSNQDESSKRKFYWTHFKAILFEYEKINFMMKVLMKKLEGL